ncbi:uncharacterized protein LOC102699990 [Oryza brachyantha]|uniref:uncharacterized protein LOC102699990 n=1 Tax=Oryza brachyantha TaxID=4533 RepID=UPI001ADAE3C0|nr:uncharacterized protein LOC102699990 [Oryza brachyantha]
MAAERVVCVDVDGGEQEQQQQEKELQLSDLPNDALQSILLRLPSPPRYLAVAAAVARNWRRQILGNSGGDGSFLRAFRGAHGGVPPLLGFFCNRQGFSCPFFTSTAAGGVAGMSPPAGTGKRRPFVHDARHGRVLLDDGEDGQLLVWDPLTRSQDVIPTPRCYFTSNDSCGASLICGCEVHAGAGDDDCHWAAFHVVVAFTDLPCFCPDEWNLDRICVRVWSSATKEWSEVYSMRGTCDFDFMPSAFVAGAVHWLVGESSAVLQFNLNTKQLALIRTPVDLSEFMLFPTKDGKLGFTGVLGSHIIFFHMDISGDALVGERVWSIQNVISIDHFFPSNVNVLATCGLADDSEEDDDDDDDDDTISDDDDDDDDDDENRGIQRTMRHDNEASGSQCLGSSDPLSHEDFDKENNSLISMISPNVDVIGFIAEANAVLLHAAGRGVYTIDVETKRTRRVAASANYSHVFPYTSFYTSAGKTVFGEPTFPDRKNKGTSGSGFKLLQSFTNWDGDELMLQVMLDSRQMEAYRAAYVQLHGPDSDWRTSPIDPVAVHMAGGGKKHGRFMIEDGFIDSTTVLGDCSPDDPRPRRRSRTDQDNTNQIEDLLRQLQQEREAREREREERDREKEREQEKDREREERAKEKEQERKERELEHKERELEKIAFQRKSTYFEAALRAIQSKLNIDLLPSVLAPLPVMLTLLTLSGVAWTGNSGPEHVGAGAVSGAIVNI